jgi:hypothetical protein
MRPWIRQVSIGCALTISSGNSGAIADELNGCDLLGRAYNSVFGATNLNPADVAKLLA